MKERKKKGRQSKTERKKERKNEKRSEKKEKKDKKRRVKEGEKERQRFSRWFYERVLERKSINTQFIASLVIPHNVSPPL